MRVGVVSKWFNRGQPVVGRYLRSALDELGHETFVLARPKKERGPRPGALDRDDVWDQPGVTEASAYDVPGAEYDAWVARNGIEAVFCDQNYGFAEIAALRARGVLTIGRFVWEHFAADHVAGAREAFDVVYSFTRSERERYARLGIDSPYVPWGCHPELVEVGREVEAARRGPGAPERAAGEAPGDDSVDLIFPGGFLGHRKPVEPVIEAFRRTSDARLRLLVKAQVGRRQLDAARELAAGDRRIGFFVGDEPTLDHLRRFAASDACLSPARWEGLGLPLYEAIAFGMPAITNDAPPMNEAVVDGLNGICVASRPDGAARSGIPAHLPDVHALAEAIERMADDAERERLAAGARELRDGERSWARTVEGIGGLIEIAASARMGAA